MQFDYQSALTHAAASGLVAVGGWLWRVGNRVEKLSGRVTTLQQQVTEKKKTLDSVSDTQVDHGRRIAVMENVVMELQKLTPSLNNLGALTAKLDAMLDATDRRITLVEDHVFKMRRD